MGDLKSLVRSGISDMIEGAGSVTVSNERKRVLGVTQDAGMISLSRGRPTYFLPQQGPWAQDNCEPWPGRMDWDGERFVPVTSGV